MKTSNIKAQTKRGFPYGSELFAQKKAIPQIVALTVTTFSSKIINSACLCFANTHKTNFKKIGEAIRLYSDEIKPIVATTPTDSAITLETEHADHGETRNAMLKLAAEIAKQCAAITGSATIQIETKNEKLAKELRDALNLLLKNDAIEVETIIPRADNKVLRGHDATAHTPTKPNMFL